MGLDKGGTMKKYLFGLGAMLVGAGLMFVLMHGEVSADQVFKEPTMDKSCCEHLTMRGCITPKL